MNRRTFFKASVLALSSAAFIPFAGRDDLGAWPAEKIGSARIVTDAASPLLGMVVFAGDALRIGDELLFVTGVDDDGIHVARAFGSSSLLGAQ